MNRRDEDERRLSEIYQRLFELRVEQGELEHEIGVLRERINGGRPNVSIRRQGRQGPLRTDAYDAEIRIGDRIRFQAGTSRSTEGRIVDFTDRYVIAEDEWGVRIRREYRNVELI